MTRKYSSIDQLSTLTARQAQSEAAIMQSDLRKLRTSLLSTGSFRVPVMRSKRTWTRRNVTMMSPVLRAQAYIIGNLLGGAIKSEYGEEQGYSGYGGGSSASTDDTPGYEKHFYYSESQFAGDLFAKLILGQRIR